MSSATLEQISTWFMRTMWPFAEEHGTVLCATAVVLLILFLILRAKLSKGIPGISDCRVRVDPCDLPPCRFFTGSVVAANSGRKSCNLLNVQLIHESLRFEISDITDRREKEFAAPERGTVGMQLPVSIKAREKKTLFFFGYHRIGRTEELPETLFLEVTFGRPKATYRHRLAHVLERTYCLDLSGRDAGEFFESHRSGRKA